MTLQAILKQALSLPPEQRVQLADEMWQSVHDTAASQELTPAQRADLQKRLMEYRAGKVRTRPWDEVRRELLKHGK